MAIKKLKKNNDNILLFFNNKMFSIWFWFFFLILAFTLCLCIFDDSINVLSDNLIVLLPTVCYLIFISWMLEYVIVRTFKGSEGEAFATLLLTVLTSLSIYGLVVQLKNSPQHES
jgi:hypothetical protein